MRGPIVLLASLALTAASVAAGLRPTSGADQILPRPRLPGATCGPVKIAFTPSSDRAIVAESDTGRVAVFDVAHPVAR